MMEKGDEFHRRTFLTRAAAVCGGILGSAPAPAQVQPQNGVGTRMPGADLVLRNGKIITVNGKAAIAEAVAIRGDRIVDVGSDEAIAAQASAATRVIDLQGKTVIPGLIDAHAHMDREGLRTIFPSLGRVRSIKDIQDRISELARNTKPGEWIVTMPVGDPPYYFNVPDVLEEKRWPTRQELDVAAPNNPVLIRCIWGFWRSTPPLVTCVNTAALQRAGITRDTVSPDPALVIEKDSNGDPTGSFVESELQPLAELIWFREATRFSRLDRARALPQSAKAYHACATTGVFEGHGVANEVLRAYQDVRRDGMLTMRAALVLSPHWKAAGVTSFAPFIEAWAGWLGEPGLGDEWLKMSGVYANIQHRASDDIRAKAAPYTGWGGYNYDTGLAPDRLRELALACARNDIRLVANAALSPGIIDIFEAVHREISLKGRRWVVGHVRSLSPRDIRRVAQMELAITPHVNSAIYKFGAGLQKNLPAERRNEIAPLRQLLDAGVRVSLGTDNVPVSMFWPIWETAARLSITNEAVAPAQAITRAEALQCATVNGAHLSFDEQTRGSIETGKLADLAVLSADPLTVEESKIRDITSVMTIAGGRVVYETAGHSL